MMIFFPLCLFALLIILSATHIFINNKANLKNRSSKVEIIS